MNVIKCQKLHDFINITIIGVDQFGVKHWDIYCGGERVTIDDKFFKIFDSNKIEFPNGYTTEIMLNKYVNLDKDYNQIKETERYMISNINGELVEPDITIV